MATALRTALADKRSGAIPQAEVRPSAATVVHLGRVEARHLVRHPAFWLAPIFGLLLLRGALGATSGGRLSLNIGWLTGGIAMGILFGTLLAANVAALRSRRDGTGELYGSLPAPPEARTLGLIAGVALGPVPVAAISAAAAWAAFERIDELARFTDPFLAAQFLMTVFALGTVGIGVARWFPSLFGGPIVIVAYVMTGLMWTAPWIVATSTGVHVGWHYVYLVAVPILWVVLALARDRRTPIRFIVAAAALAIGIIAVIQQLPPGGSY